MSHKGYTRCVHPDEDAAAIAAIYNPYITDTTVTFETEPLSVEGMKKRIHHIFDEEGGGFLVYVIDGHIAGYVYAHPWKERAGFRNTWETAVYVAPEYQGRGIGTYLMQDIIQWCKDGGIHALVACITGENKGSQRMHARLGFRQVSRFKEVGYKFGRWLDVIDYELIILNNPKNYGENLFWMENLS